MKTNQLILYKNKTCFQRYMPHARTHTHTQMRSEGRTWDFLMLNQLIFKVTIGL